MISEINNNTLTIGGTLTTEAANVGYTLTEAMKSIWCSNDETNVVAVYGRNFNDKLTTINTTLNAINAKIKDANKTSDKVASTNISSSSSTSNSKPTSTSTTSKPTSTPTSKQISVGGKINAGNARIYATSQGTGGGMQYYKKDPIYTVLGENNGYLKTRWYKLSSGITGWFKKGDVKAYKTGARRINDSEYAWTQEGRKPEFIVRPSDGAILTPLAKNDSVLNANASSNIWDMANSPADFIKNNLDLGVGNVPNNSTVQNNISQNFDQIVFNMPNVKSYDEMLSALKSDSKFEKLIMAMTIDRIAGGSKLAKNKAIR